MLPKVNYNTTTAEYSCDCVLTTNEWVPETKAPIMRGGMGTGSDYSINRHINRVVSHPQESLENTPSRNRLTR